MLRGNRRTVLTVLAIVLGTFVAGFVASVVLAGCSEEPSTPPTTPPATTTAPSPTPTPTPTPTPDAATPPQRPDMSTVDAETAEAVATYFLQLYPYVYATGDLAEWRELSHPECIFCASVITNVEQMLTDGHSSEGSVMSDFALTADEVTPGAFFAVEGTYSEGPSVERDSAGAVVSERLDTDALRLVAAITYDGRWSVREMDISRLEGAP